MEKDKIIYYYPMEGCASAAKRFWFQEVALRARILYEECDGALGPEPEWNQSGRGIALDAEFQVIGCAVPVYYYRCRPWKPQVLSEAMEAVVHCVAGMSDTWLHPQIIAMLTPEYGRRWMPRRDTLQIVMKRLVGKYAGRLVRQCGEVTLLLGDPADTDWQMDMTRELLLPYMTRINRLLIFYEEIAETDIWMELGNHLDEYYYEYGLVPQLESYRENYAGVQGRTRDEMTLSQYFETGDNLRCGKVKCGGLILDYSERYRYPKIMPESSVVYIDAVSAGDKEQVIKRKTPQVQYVSPLKYLDTMVKNSYDR